MPLTRQRRIGRAVLVTFLFYTACAPATVCPRREGAQIDVRCLEENLRKGQTVAVRTLDGLSHRGSFVRLEQSADSSSLVLSQRQTSSELGSRTLSFNVAALDSISEVRGSSILQPIPVLAEITVIAALFYMLVASQINLSGLN